MKCFLSFNFILRTIITFNLLKLQWVIVLGSTNSKYRLSFNSILNLSSEKKNSFHFLPSWLISHAFFCDISFFLSWMQLGDELGTWAIRLMRHDVLSPFSHFSPSSLAWIFSDREFLTQIGIISLFIQLFFEIFVCDCELKDYAKD